MNRHNGVSRGVMIGLVLVIASIVMAATGERHLLAVDHYAPVSDSTSNSLSNTESENTSQEISAFSKMEADIFNLINAARKQKNLQPFVWNEQVASAALKHSRNMADGKTPFGHPNFDHRMKAIKIPQVTLMGWSENVASGQLTAKEVVNGWLNSPGHKKNIMGLYHYTGIGIAKNKQGKLYFTQIFVRKAGK